MITPPQSYKMSSSRCFIIHIIPNKVLSRKRLQNKLLCLSYEKVSIVAPISTLGKGWGGHTWPAPYSVSSLFFLFFGENFTIFGALDNVHLASFYGF